MNYGELKTVIKGYLHRDDMDDVIATAIALAGARIGRDLRHRTNYTGFPTMTSTVGQIYLEYMREVVSVKYGDQFRTILQVVSAEEIGVIQAAGGSTPTSWAYKGGVLEVAPVSDGVEVQIWCYAQPQPFTDDSETNDVLLYAPQLYVYGALSECFFWIQDGDLLLAARKQYQDEIASLNAETYSAATGVNPRMQRVR